MRLVLGRLHLKPKEQVEPLVENEQRLHSDLLLVDGSREGVSHTLGR
jgi:hypothetical protein